MKRLTFILLYGLLTPLLLVGIANTRLYENVAEAVRPDMYSTGTWFYLILFGTLVLLNSVFILLTKKVPPVKVFFATLALSLATSVVMGLGICLLFVLAIGARIGGGHWNFG